MSEGPDLAEYVAETLDIGPGTEVFEVGCGDGAFLVPLYDNGYLVGGVDADPALIAAARVVMPDGRFTTGAAGEVDPAVPWHVVICRGFGTFPDVDYARGVLARIAAKATHAVALLDVPEARFDRRWMLHAFAEVGVSAVQIEWVKTAGRDEEEARYNVFARP